MSKNTTNADVRKLLRRTVRSHSSMCVPRVRTVPPVTLTHTTVKNRGLLSRTRPDAIAQPSVLTPSDRPFGFVWSDSSSIRHFLTYYRDTKLSDARSGKKLTGDLNAVVKESDGIIKNIVVHRGVRFKSWVQRYMLLCRYLLGTFFLRAISVLWDVIKTNSIKVC